MREAVRWSDDDSVMRAGLARAYAVAGDAASARALAATLEKGGGRGALYSYELALVHLGLGERARALDALDRANEERSGWMVYLDVDPRLDPIRDDERFAAIAGARKRRTRRARARA